MEESVRLGRLAGIPIGMNWSVLLTIWLLSWSLAGGELPASSPGYSPAQYWVAGVAAAVVFLASLLAHELGHALVARAHGVRVERITLWLFGGVARLGGEAATPAAELRIAVAGPAVSVGLAVVFGGVALSLRPFGAPGLLIDTAAWLATINVVLAVFNLVPAAPLDGGRLLRAALWHHHGDRLKASVSASNAGRGFAFVLISFGLVLFALGGGLGGLWLTFMGWFLLNAAGAERTDALLRGGLAGVRLRDIMTSDPIVAPEALSVSAFIEQYVMRHRCSAFPLVGHDGAVTGLVTLSDLKGVPAERRGAVAVRDVAHPLSEVAIGGPDDAITDILSRLGAEREGRVLVFAGGALVGIISPSDIMRLLRVTMWSGRAGPGW